MPLLSHSPPALMQISSNSVAREHRKSRRPAAPQEQAGAGKGGLGKGGALLSPAAVMGVTAVHYPASPRCSCELASSTACTIVFSS